MIAQICGTLLHLAWLYLFVTHLEMGIFGLGLATLVTNLGLMAMITVYAWQVPRVRQSMICFNKHAFQGWCEYLKLGVPAMVMTCAEWWSFEILIILSGILGTQQQAAMVIIF